jgi:hypothetical protein
MNIATLVNRVAVFIGDSIRQQAHRLTANATENLGMIAHDQRSNKVTLIPVYARHDSCQHPFCLSFCSPQQ